jgi:hypothetical protein
MGHSAKARMMSMIRFAIGMNISRLNAPLNPAFENILHQMMTAKMIVANPIRPKTSPKLAIIAAT